MKDSPKAAQAFADYVAMGPSRSLSSLCERYRTGTKPVPTNRLTTLKEWSIKYGWQARIAEAATERAREMLEQASEIDAQTFLATSVKLNQRVKLSDPLMLDGLVKLRESVRKPAPKGGTNVNVGVSVSLTTEQREIAERIAASRGVVADEVIAEVERFLQEERS